MSCPNDIVEQLGPFKRIIACVKCQTEKARISLHRAAHLNRKQLDNQGHVILTSTTSTPLPSIGDWTLEQKKVANTLGLTVNLNPCSECGNPIKQGKRAQKLQFCETHAKEYRHRKNLEYKRASRARGKNTD